MKQTALNCSQDPYHALKERFSEFTSHGNEPPDAAAVGLAAAVHAEASAINNLDPGQGGDANPDAGFDLERTISNVQSLLAIVEERQEAARTVCAALSKLASILEGTCEGLRMLRPHSRQASSMTKAAAPPHPVDQPLNRSVLRDAASRQSASSHAF